MRCQRRRTKGIPHFFDEKGGLKLCYAALLRASRRWQRVTITEFDRTRRATLRAQLHQEYLARRGQPAPTHRAKSTHLSPSYSNADALTEN